MAIVKFPESALSMKTVGVIGRPWGAGRILAGYSWVGDENEYSGVYQRRPRATGQILVKMKHYRSPNPQTDKQQAWRMYFKDILAVWHALPAGIRDDMRARKYPVGMGGWNRYCRAYMRRKPSQAGVMRAGMCPLGDLTL